MIAVRTTIVLLSLVLLCCQHASAQYFTYSAIANWPGSCQNGTLQSPLNLRADMAVLENQRGSPVTLNYSTNATLLPQRRADSVQQLLVPFGNNITINGTQYRVQSLHWHTPSEHALNGRHGLAELHIVHYDPQQNLGVIGVLYSRGTVADPLLQLFLDNLPPTAPQGQASNGSAIAGVNLRSLVNNIIPNGTVGSFLTYTGSLTTPPCTEGVKWLLSSRNGTVTDAQILTLQGAIGDDGALGTNSRPLQAGGPSQQVLPL